MNEHPLKKYRKANGLTASALGRLIGASKATVSRIEGGTQDPSMELLRRIVSLTGLRADDFLIKTTREAAE